MYLENLWTQLKTVYQQGPYISSRDAYLKWSEGITVSNLDNNLNLFCQSQADPKICWAYVGAKTATRLQINIWYAGAALSAHTLWEHKKYGYTFKNYFPLPICYPWHKKCNHRPRFRFQGQALCARSFKSQCNAYFRFTIFYK